MAARVRLYIETPLYGGRELDLDESRSHYLSNVMKLAAGDAFLGFDGRSGEFEMQIAAVSKKHCRVIVGERLREFQPVPDIWLLFAPVKKDQTDFIIQKAVELGARRLQPVITRRTITDKVRHERFRAQGIEAAEQCRRLDVPEINEAQSLEKVLQNWDKSRRLFLWMKPDTACRCAALLPPLRRRPQFWSDPKAVSAQRNCNGCADLSLLKA